jgi:hypothetical protein
VHEVSTSRARPIESPLSAVAIARLSRDGPCGTGWFDELIALPDVHAKSTIAAPMIDRFMNEEFPLVAING